LLGSATRPKKWDNYLRIAAAVMTASHSNNPASLARIPSSATQRIFGRGEMADLIRTYDWTTTPLGSIDQWPDTLVTTVNMLLANRNPMFLWWGPDLIQFYNDAYRPSIAGDKHPKAVGQRGIECWPEIWSTIGPQIEGVMNRGEATWHEDQFLPIYRDGKLEDVYWTYSYSPVRDAAGAIQGTLVTCSETTGRVKAEAQLRTERARLIEMFQQAPAFVAVLGGPEHIFELTNPLYQVLIGNRDIIGKSVREAIPEAQEQGFLEILDNVYRTGTPFVAYGYSINLARSAGQPLQERTLDFVYQPRQEADGSISGIIVLGVDVTDRKLAEQALRNSEKLAAVGRLAASIAHEINNPLEAVTNLLYLAAGEHLTPDAKRYIDMAQQEMARVSTIATQTLRFHRQSTQARNTALADIMESVITLFQGRAANAGVAIQKQYRSKQQVLAYEGDLRQVFTNLIANALDASGTGARIVIRTRDVIDFSTREAGVRLTIADTGHGMSEEIRTRIFEPFFTTKTATGTGLGLWVTNDILQTHNAKLRVRSSREPQRHGTVFSIFFPQNRLGTRRSSLLPRTT
jgi:signal transduction histidine kinase